MDSIDSFQEFLNARSSSDSRTGLYDHSNSLDASIPSIAKAESIDEDSRFSSHHSYTNSSDVEQAGYVSTPNDQLSRSVSSSSQQSGELLNIKFMESLESHSSPITPTIRSSPLGSSHSSADDDDNHDDDDDDDGDDDDTSVGGESISSIVDSSSSDSVISTHNSSESVPVDEYGDDFENTCTSLSADCSDSNSLPHSNVSSSKSFPSAEVSESESQSQQGSGIDGNYIYDFESASTFTDTEPDSAQNQTNYTADYDTTDVDVDLAQASKISMQSPIQPNPTSTTAEVSVQTQTIAPFTSSIVDRLGRAAISRMSLSPGKESEAISQALNHNNASKLVFNDLLKTQIQFTRQYIAANQRLAQATTTNFSNQTQQYTYTTWKDTELYIHRNKQPIISYEEALKDSYEGCEQ